jgi:hypothetical protein
MLWEYATCVVSALSQDCIDENLLSDYPVDVSSAFRATSHSAAREYPSGRQRLEKNGCLTIGVARLGPS